VGVSDPVHRERGVDATTRLVYFWNGDTMPWRKILIGLAVLGSLVVLCGYLVLSSAPFGAAATGERLARIESHPRFRDGAFTNVEPQASTGFADLLTYLKSQFFYDEVRVPPNPIPVVPVTTEQTRLRAEDSLRAFWIGHSSVYVEIDGVRVLTDPVFSEYASPFDIGPKRFHPPPIALDELPKIDAVVISHDHYDHLDHRTVAALAEGGTEFFVPLGVGAHLERWGIAPDQIHDLDWWEERQLGNLRIVSTPTRHYSGRGLGDYKAKLWSSWAIVGPSHRFYYSGDTGYSSHFKEIGEKLGPFDLTLIKVGAYGPGQAWIDVHMEPEPAMRAHLDVGGETLLPVHWATFNLANHDWDEPIRRTVAEGARLEIDVVTPRIGEWIEAPGSQPSQAWWEGIR
jgi:L-ascorbate metabolism protein UlaG (beta-lactamase superfamily)